MQEKIELVTKYLTSKEKITSREMRDLLKVGETEVKKVLRHMVSKKIIERRGLARSTYYILREERE